jgi:hypothetical protein
MARYVLKHRGAEPRGADLELIERSAEVTILDRSAPQAMLVDAPEKAARNLQEQLPDWTVAEEVTYPQPGPTRKQIRSDVKT